jgi:hypothetical protein
MTDRPHRLEVDDKRRGKEERADYAEPQPALDKVGIDAKQDAGYHWHELCLPSSIQKIRHPNCARDDAEEKIAHGRAPDVIQPTVVAARLLPADDQQYDPRRDDRDAGPARNDGGLFFGDRKLERAELAFVRLFRVFEMTVKQAQKAGDQENDSQYFRAAHRCSLVDSLKWFEHHSWSAGRTIAVARNEHESHGNQTRDDPAIVPATSTADPRPMLPT